jgi:hypothetical protein
MLLVSKLVVDIEEDPEDELKVVTDLVEDNLTEDIQIEDNLIEDNLTEDIQIETTKRDAVQDKIEPTVNQLEEVQEEEEVIDEVIEENNLLQDTPADK